MHSWARATYDAFLRPVAHRDIRSEPARRGELGLGVLTHYELNVKGA